AILENLRQPLLVLGTFPLALIGVIWAMVFTGSTLNILAMMAVVMLVGIVVNNAIVMIDYFNILRKRGMKLSEAVKTGAKRRLRPILMTTGTTVFGLLPLALSTGSGSVLWKSLGISVVGGMIVSSFITLLLIPTLYMMFESKLKRSFLNETD
ncbi:MAG: efflux RND transporter permease subunit, partial [candidate division WOR-3 bacterium]